MNSAAANDLPEFTFATPEVHQQRIMLFECTDASAAACDISKGLFELSSHPAAVAPGVLRLENLELERIDLKQKAWLLVLEQGCRITSPSYNMNGSRPVDIMALFIKGDPCVRWFYSVVSISPLLLSLRQKDFVRLAKVFDPGSRGHQRLFAFVRAHSLHVVTIPHSQAWIQAVAMQDYCVEIVQPGGALARVRELKEWKGVKPPIARRKEEDRYASELEPVEREIARDMGLGCAEYMRIKRNFFAAFYKELRENYEETSEDETTPTLHENPGDGSGVVKVEVSNDQPQYKGHATKSQRLPSPPRTAKRGKTVGVRTDDQHAAWLKKAYKWRVARNGMLVAAWKTLGILEEESYEPWIKLEREEDA